MKIYLDAGHGGSDPGAAGNRLQEKEVVLDLAIRIRRLLYNYPQATVKLSRTTDVTKSLRARTNEANSWGAGIFLSLHCNAFNGRARGYEDFVYNKLPREVATRSYQVTLHEKVRRAIGIPNRGMKQANFHVLRESNMPAILTENGFIDHPEDAKLMKQTAWREKVAAAHVDGLVEIFKLKKAVSPSKGGYQLIAGSFAKQSNAKARQVLLNTRQIPATVKQVSVNGKTMHRVIIGTYSSRTIAENKRKQILQLGIETFILRDN